MLTFGSTVGRVTTSGSGCRRRTAPNLLSVCVRMFSRCSSRHTFNKNPLKLEDYRSPNSTKMLLRWKLGWGKESEQPLAADVFHLCWRPGFDPPLCPLARKKKTQHLLSWFSSRNKRQGGFQATQRTINDISENLQGAQNIRFIL